MKIEKVEGVCPVCKKLDGLVKVRKEVGCVFCLKEALKEASIIKRSSKNVYRPNKDGFGFS